MIGSLLRPNRFENTFGSVTVKDGKIWWRICKVENNYILLICIRSLKIKQTDIYDIPKASEILVNNSFVTIKNSFLHLPF